MSKNWIKHISNFTKQIKTIAVLVFIPFLSIFSQNKVDFFSAENRLKFGDYLYCQKDYLRAFDEYSAYLSSHNNDTILFKMSLALREMKRYSEAEDYLVNLSFNSNLSERARIELFKTYFINKEKNKIFDEYKNKRFVPQNNKSIKSLYYVSQLLWSNILPDSIDFTSAFEKDINKKMGIFYHRKRHPNHKDEITAGILSAVIPGLGKIYNEDYGDGITAFIFTSALGYIAYSNFQAQHNFRAWLFTGLTALFYGGNVYGSIVSAQLYNAAEDAKYESELLQFVKQENYFDNQSTDFCK